MFREAGLDPEKPPRTIAELESFNEKLTRKNADGSLAQIGHMPQEPGWWMHDFPSWFGGASWDGGTQLLLDATPNRHFFGWLESYPKRFGGPAMFQLRGAFGNFASPDNPFFNGKVAMIMQGVWMNNFIKNYAPADFNNSQDKIFVRFLSVSRIDQKMMLATAGGVPPDVVGLWAINLNRDNTRYQLCSFCQENELGVNQRVSLD